jgi:uncharacterized membrane protein
MKFVNLIKALVPALLVVCMAGMLAGCGGDQPSADAQSGNTASEANETGASDPSTTAADQANHAPATPEGQPIVIPISELSDQARFYPTTVDGLAVEVLAVQAPDGSYRTALNTCQVCYDSGYGYYIQDGDVLVCQNCGNQFPMAAVEIESGGCNPVPIFDELKEVTGDSITIPVATLQAAAPYFADWKRS